MSETTFDDDEFKDVNFDTIEENDKEVADVDIARYSPPVSLERIDKDTVIANMKAQQEIFEAFLEYVKNTLKPKVDYYTIVAGAKPSLGQTGAEKILDFLRIYPKFAVTHRVLSKSEISYDVTCNLYSKVDQRQVGSGGGFCSSQEDNYLYEWVYEKYLPKGIDKKNLEVKNFKGKDGKWFSKYRMELANHYNVANTVKKMGLKRAFVDATVRSTFASHIFTQDLEDSYIGTKLAREETTPIITPKTSNKTSTSPVEPRKAKTDTKTQATVNEALKYPDLDPQIYVMSGGKHKGERMIDCPSHYIEWNIDTAKKSKYKQTFEKVPMGEWVKFLEVCLKTHIALKEAKAETVTDKDLEPEFADIEQATPEELEKEFGKEE
uniref:Uncharacterized protein n=1 Tax=viral metagenome TaxID=1070528 RepID=A0A6H1ZD10_9ZZZZ